MNNNQNENGYQVPSSPSSEPTYPVDTSYGAGGSRLRGSYGVAAGREIPAYAQTDQPVQANQQPERVLYTDGSTQAIGVPQGGASSQYGVGGLGSAPVQQPPAGAYAAQPTQPAASSYGAGAGYGQAQHDTGSARQVDTSGFDIPGDSPTVASYPPASANRTGSFSAARSGDTDTMPRIAADASDAKAGYSTGVSQPAQHTGAAGGRSSSQPAVSEKKSAKQPSAGKTFLFGFLGALVACALAIGGFAIVNGGIIRTQTSTTTIGTTDPSVIDAVDEGKTLAEAVAAKALPSVVAIYNYQDASSMYGYGFGFGYGTQGGDSVVQAGMGSGVVISEDGYILTNYHVVEGHTKLTVTVDGKERDAQFIGGDISSDVAVIKVEDAEGLVPADIGDSDSLVIGEWVMTVGAPLGLEQSVATGVVSATNRDNVMASGAASSDPYSQLFGNGNTNPEYVYYPNMIQTDAVINPGNSGGALVDADGKLIGINSIIASQSGNYAGVGFAIPINYAKNLAEDIIAGKKPTHAMLGVSLSQVNSTIAQRYNLSSDTGAYISAITPGTGADDSDLQVGDIITAIDGAKITSATDVTLEVRSHKVGDTVKVTVNRDGETKDIDVKLTSDEDMNVGGGEDQQQEMQQNGGQERYGDGGGLTQEQLERLMEMLGM